MLIKKPIDPHETFFLWNSETFFFPMLSLLISLVISQGCQPLLINDFQLFPNNTMGGFAGDDGTMRQVLVQQDTQTVTLTSINPASIYYETGFCPNFRQDWVSLEIQVATLEQGTYFAIDFQTSDLCDGPVVSNIVKPFTNGLSLAAASQNTFRIDLPAGVGRTLRAVVIEDLQPVEKPVIFGKMRLLCPEAEKQDSSALSLSFSWLLLLLLF
jgi:hypothetical protein